MGGLRANTLSSAGPAFERRAGDRGGSLGYNACPMTVVQVYLRIYATCFQKALVGCRRNAWTLLLPIGLWSLLLLAGMLVGGAGMVGGMVVGLVMDAVLSSYLYFVGEIVSESKARFSELKGSFLAYFWSVLGVAFVIFVVQLLLGMLLAGSSQSAVVFLLVYAGAFVLCNATPEVIYQKGTNGGVATIQQSIRFIHENWVEWFIPIILLAGLNYLVISGLMLLGMHPYLLAIPAGALVHFMMVFRGYLFRELDGSGHRQRMYKFANRPQP